MCAVSGEKVLSVSVWVAVRQSGSFQPEEVMQGSSSSKHRGEVSNCEIVNNNCVCFHVYNSLCIYSLF